MENKHFKALRYLFERHHEEIDWDKLSSEVPTLTEKDHKKMQRMGWISLNDGEFNIEPKGAQIMNSKNLQEEIGSLREFERKSAAVETLFTIVLVMFGMSQVMGQFYSASGMKLHESLMVIGSFLTGLGAISISLQIGWENLLRTIKNETWLKVLF